MGKHITVLGTDVWDWEITGRTWIVVFLTGLLGAAAFDLFLLLPWNLLILLMGGETPGYGLLSMLPLYALMGVCGFCWGLQFGFDSYYPKNKEGLGAGLSQPISVLRPIAVVNGERPNKD